MFDFKFGFGFAIAGIMDAIRRERNFRLQWLMGMMVLLWMDLLPFDFWQQIALFILVFLVLASELNNCAIEKTCDSIGKEHHIDKKRAKDFGAASVLMMSLVAAMVFLLFVIESFEAVIYSLVLKPASFGVWWLVLIFNLPMAMTLKSSRPFFALFLLSLPSNLLFIYLSFDAPGFWLVGAAFHAAMAICVISRRSSRDPAKSQ